MDNFENSENLNVQQPPTKKVMITVPQGDALLQGWSEIHLRKMGGRFYKKSMSWKLPEEFLSTSPPTVVVLEETPVVVVSMEQEEVIVPPPPTAPTVSTTTTQTVATVVIVVDKETQTDIPPILPISDIPDISSDIPPPILLEEQFQYRKCGIEEEILQRMTKYLA